MASQRSAGAAPARLPFAGGEADGAGVSPVGEKARRRRLRRAEDRLGAVAVDGAESRDKFLYGLTLSIGPNGPVGIFVRGGVKIAAEPAVQLA